MKPSNTILGSIGRLSQYGMGGGGVGGGTLSGHDTGGSASDDRILGGTVFGGFTEFFVII